MNSAVNMQALLQHKLLPICPSAALAAVPGRFDRVLRANLQAISKEGDTSPLPWALLQRMVRRKAVAVMRGQEVQNMHAKGQVTSSELPVIDWRTAMQHGVVPSQLAHALKHWRNGKHGTASAALSLAMGEGGPTLTHAVLGDQVHNRLPHAFVAWAARPSSAEQQQRDSTAVPLWAAHPSFLVACSPHWAVVNKPPSVACQGNGEGATLAHSWPWLQQAVGAVHPAAPAAAGWGPRLGHRLDVGVSGALCVPLTQACAAAFAADLRQGAVSKVYVGVAQGVVAGARRLFTPDATGRKCETHVMPLGPGMHTPQGPTTLLRLVPFTGGKHQLRLACAAGLGAPLVGDAKYGGGRLGGGMALHAHSLEWQGRPDAGIAPVAVTVPLPRHMRGLGDWGAVLR